MKCQRLKVDGVVAIVCGLRPPRRRRCRVCGRLEEKLFECDWPLPGGGTCDLLICERCRIPVGPDKDLCPAHAFVLERPDPS